MTAINTLIILLIVSVLIICIPSKRVNPLIKFWIIPIFLIITAFQGILTLIYVSDAKQFVRDFKSAEKTLQVYRNDSESSFELGLEKIIEMNQDLEWYKQRNKTKYWGGITPDVVDELEYLK